MSLFGHSLNTQTRAFRRFLRFWPALACPLLPLMFFCLFRYVVRSLVFEEKVCLIAGPPPPSFVSPPLRITGALLSSNYLPPEASRFADSMRLSARASDLAGRLEFTIPSAILIFIALTTVLLAFVVIIRRASFPLNIWLCLAGAIVGSIVAINFMNNAGITREIIVYPILHALETERLTTASVTNCTDLIVEMNVGAGIFSTIIVLLALAVLSVPASPQRLNASALRGRIRDFRALMIAVAGVLVLTVIITRALIHWQLDFLSEEARKPLLPLATAIANYWGASSTGFMLAAFIPPFLIWRYDVSRFAGDHLTQSKRYEYLADRGLVLAPTAAFTALLSVAAPALVTPVLDAIGTFVQGQAG